MARATFDIFLQNQTEMAVLKEKKEEKKASPEATANIFSKLTVWFVFDQNKTLQKIYDCLSWKF